MVLEVSRWDFEVRRFAGIQGETLRLNMARAKVKHLRAPHRIS